VTALVWSYVGKVDEVAVAQGRIIPSGKVKVIQPLEIGTVQNIAVKEGQQVKAGDILVEIDPTESRAEVARLRQEVTENRIQALRLAVMAAATGAPEEAVASFTKQVPAGTDEVLAAKQASLLESALVMQAATVAGIESNMAQKQAELKQVETEIAKLKAIIPLVEKRARLRGDLVAEGYSSVLEASRESQSLIESQQALVEDGHKAEAAKAVLSQLEAQKSEAVSKFVSSALTEEVEATRKANDAAQQLIKAEDLAQKRTLTAPVDGIVQQIAVHTVGGIVTPAQQLMVVVPQDAKLEIEAQVQNKDIGFVREGQEVEVKLETFPFTRYGLRHGTILHVSRDTAAAPPENGAKDRGGESSAAPQPETPLYTARISLDRMTMPVDGQEVALTPGMAVTAEIKTSQQRVIDFLLDPIRRIRHDSFTER